MCHHGVSRWQSTSHTYTIIIKDLRGRVYVANERKPYTLHLLSVGLGLLIWLTVIVVSVCECHTGNPNCTLKIHQPVRKTLFFSMWWWLNVPINSMRAITTPVVECGALLGRFFQSIINMSSYWRNKTKQKAELVLMTSRIGIHFIKIRRRETTLSLYWEILRCQDDIFILYQIVHQSIQGSRCREMLRDFKTSGGCLKIKTTSCPYRNFHYKDKTVARTSDFTVEILIHGKTVLYRDMSLEAESPYSSSFAIHVGDRHLNG